MINNMIKLLSFLFDETTTKVQLLRLVTALFFGPDLLVPSIVLHNTPPKAPGSAPQGFPPVHFSQKRLAPSFMAVPRDSISFRGRRRFSMIL